MEQIQVHQEMSKRGDSCRAVRRCDFRCDMALPHRRGQAYRFREVRGMDIAVMISIQPKWCELIANGKKTVEVRKTKPKIETPFKCYIYFCKPKMKLKYVFHENDYPEYMRPCKTAFCKVPDTSSPYCSEIYGSGKIIGEFVCDSIIRIQYNKSGYGLDDNAINGVVAKSCVQEKELYHYLKGKIPYLWHISNLVIYDEPKELSEFYVGDTAATKNCQYRFRAGQPEDITKHGGFIYGSWVCGKDYEPHWCENCIKKPLKRPPQSWCYVEELK